MINIFSIFTNVINFLLNSTGYISISRLEIRNGKISIFVQGFPVNDFYLLTGFCIFDYKRRITGYVLPKVKHNFTIWNRNLFSLKGFFCSYRHRLSRHQYLIGKIHFSCRMPKGCIRKEVLFCGIIILAQFQIG